MKSGEVTEHRSSLVLFASSFSDVARNAEVDHNEIFIRVLLRIKVTNNGESMTLIDFVPECLKLLSKSKKGEIGWVDFLAFEFEVYKIPYQRKSWKLN
jgi:hypothetical protein